MKTDIKEFPLKELRAEMACLDERPFRAEQIYAWLYKKGEADFTAMRNLPEKLIRALEKRYSVRVDPPARTLRSPDGTEKYLFELRDKNRIETVLIPQRGRRTVCISTQVGCKFSCAFCASGIKGFVRDLASSEMIDQIYFIRFIKGDELTNYVFMGMGEPLDNYDNLAKAIRIMNEKKGLNIGARRITVSTSGIIPGLKKLKDLDLQINLSISLHAANDELRDKLVPVNKRYPLKVLTAACEDYISATGRMITLEYALIKDENDSPGDIRDLSAIAVRLNAKVNVIGLSPVDGLGFRIPSLGDVDTFAEALKRTGVPVTIRKSRGGEIGAACGQLAGGNEL